MVYQDIFNYAKEFSLLSSTGVEDFADKLNSRYIIMIFWICSTIIGVKSYVFSPISCYMASSLDAANFGGYVTNYCWIHGTIPLRIGEKFPRNDEWYHYDEHRRIYYYQWILLVLGLQSIMFYIPKLFWKLLQSAVSQSDIEEIMILSQKLTSESKVQRDSHIANIARTIENILRSRKRVFMAQKKSISSSISSDLFNTRERISDTMSRVYRLFCVVSLDGGKIPMVYGVIKMLYLGNALLQIYIMQKFIGHPSFFFGFELIRDLFNGRGWRETGHFPRVSYCFCKGIQVLGSEQKYVAQCVLPVNMLAEKIYIVLWFAVALALISTVLSLISWIFRMLYSSSYLSFVYKYLRCFSNFSSKHTTVYKTFITHFLCSDGVFLLRMIESNTTHVVMVDLIHELFLIYVKNYFSKELSNATLLKKDACHKDHLTIPLTEIKAMVMPEPLAPPMTP